MATCYSGLSKENEVEIIIRCHKLEKWQLHVDMETEPSEI